MEKINDSGKSEAEIKRMWMETWATVKFPIESFTACHVLLPKSKTKLFSEQTLTLKNCEVLSLKITRVAPFKSLQNVSTGNDWCMHTGFLHSTGHIHTLSSWSITYYWKCFITCNHKAWIQSTRAMTTLTKIFHLVRDEKATQLQSDDVMHEEAKGSKWSQ